MKSFETTLSELKKLHARATSKVESLAAQRDHILSRLQDAQQQAARTEEAIAALEGRTTEIKQALLELGKRAGENATGISNEVTKLAVAENPLLTEMREIPQNGNPDLPAPEPGMKWAKNDLGEDVLVPINAPKPLTVPGVVEVAAGAFVMPADDSWDDPTSFL